MLLRSVVVGAAFLTGAMVSASAEETIVVPAPGVVVHDHDRPTIDKRTTIEERGGCDTKTVRKEGPEGSTTVRKERCD